MGAITFTCTITIAITTAFSHHLLIVQEYSDGPMHNYWWTSGWWYSMKTIIFTIYTTKITLILHLQSQLHFQQHSDNWTLFKLAITDQHHQKYESHVRNQWFIKWLGSGGVNPNLGLKTGFFFTRALANLLIFFLFLRLAPTSSSSRSHRDPRFLPLSASPV